MISQPVKGPYLNCIDLLRLFYPSLVNSKKSKPYSVGFMHSGGEKPLSNQEITDSGTLLQGIGVRAKQDV